MELATVEQRIPPVRGLVLAQNRRGRRFSPVDLKKWIRLSRVLFGVDKIDVLVTAGDPEALLLDLLDCARLVDVRLSLRTDGNPRPDGLPALKEAGLFDVFLCPASLDAPSCGAWLEAARAAGLPIRLQLQPPFARDRDAAAAADRVAAAGVAAVNVALSDPFQAAAPCAGVEASRATVDYANALVEALEAREVEANLLRLPLCLVTESNRARGGNSPQFFLDHQQYNRRAYELAEVLHRRTPHLMRITVTLLLAENTLHRYPVDGAILRWLLHNPWFYARMVAWRKLTRHLQRFGLVGEEREDAPGTFEKQLRRFCRQRERALGPVCSQCSLQRICDHETEEFRRLLPGLAVTALAGEPVVSPFHFSARQRKYYDAIDAQRRGFDAAYLELARRAAEIVTNHPPDRQVSPLSFGVENCTFDVLEGGTRWHSITNTEKLSWPLPRVDAPFALAVTFGGGIADYIGFSFGRHCKIVCPMEAYRHELVLHVDAEGRYALLRDREPVRPAEFEGMRTVPLRLGGYLDPRISIWNIDANIVTQFINIWDGDKTAAAVRERIKYSVIIVTTRYARRLQATLNTLAHQEGFDLRSLEVILCYVPGLDATDDVIDSMRMTHPELRIVRYPFAPHHTHSKGFMINEALQAASGEWIVLMDSDVLIPPNMFAKVDEAAKDAVFIASDGRKMLSREATAKVLLGEIEPWRQWETLLRESGEYRRREALGVPIGFFQCVKASCAEKVRYAEVEHFEGADMWFGIQMRENFGREIRLSGLPVIHLDHGGSQWYGAQKHF